MYRSSLHVCVAPAKRGREIDGSKGASLVAGVSTPNYEKGGRLLAPLFVIRCAKMGTQDEGGEVVMTWMSQEADVDGGGDNRKARGATIVGLPRGPQLRKRWRRELEEAADYLERKPVEREWRCSSRRLLFQLLLMKW